MAHDLTDLINTIFKSIENYDYIKENNLSVATLIKTLDKTSTNDIPEADIVVISKIIDRKRKYGSSAISFTVEVKDVVKPMYTTIYLSEKNFGDIIIFVNDTSHDLITSGSGKTAVDKVMPHISKYFENSIRSMLGIESPKKDNNNK